MSSKLKSGTFFKDLLANELVTRYYYQRGSIEHSLKTDSAVIRARRLLSDELAYRAILDGVNYKL